MIFSVASVLSVVKMLKILPVIRACVVAAAIGSVCMCSAVSAAGGAPEISTGLFGVLERPPPGLPPVPQPASNQVDAAKAALGRKLFFDRRLSFNRTLSCAMCHVPEQGFTSNDLSVPIGIEGRSGRRNTPTLYNVAYIEALFHDGREISLETLIVGPLTKDTEMGNPSIGHVLGTMRSLSDYDGLFESAFPGRALSVDTLGMAFASYLRLLVSGNSAFDRWHYGGDAAALEPAAQQGFRIFSGKGGCTACHAVGADHALFTDNRFHNTGIGWRNTVQRKPERRRVLAAPGQELEVEQRHIEAVRQRQRPSDLGRYEVTQDPADLWAFRTPTLRNVALTAPYMHDGSLPTLEDVIEFYDGGGHANERLSPLLRPLNLEDRDKRALAAFLRSLTGDNVESILIDARAGRLSAEGEP
jgi:cytochrome c peroxidase